MLEREAMAVLVSAKGVFYGAREAALKKAGSALNVLADPYAYEKEFGREGAQAVERAVRNGERILGRIADAGVHLVALGEEGYPQRLAQIPHPPHLLFAQGTADLDDALSMAIVGTRRASEYGLRNTRRIARELAEAGVCIVSGLALGIDAAAHEGALDAKGRTIAVLGGAIDRFYPLENERLRDRILAQGGSIVSEYPMGVAPNKYSFLIRNRIIAGLSMGVLVTEGPMRSGAQRTASDAADFGREVFALPGSVESVNSQLPHKLIAEGAYLAACGADMLQVLAPQLAGEVSMQRAAQERAGNDLKPPQKLNPPAEEKRERTEAAAQIPCDLPQNERSVLTALLQGEKEFDELSEETGIDAMTLGALLMALEMDGLIDALPGLRYVRRA